MQPSTPNQDKSKRSSYRTQKRAVLVLVASIALLALLLVAVNYIVSIFPYTDTADGSKYYAKKTGGVYSVYDASGEELPQNESGYYLTPSGTQLVLNKQTGKISPYAVVDVEGLEVASNNSRILMFLKV